MLTLQKDAMDLVKISDKLGSNLQARGRCDIFKIWAGLQVLTNECTTLLSKGLSQC